MMNGRSSWNISITSYEGDEWCTNSKHGDPTATAATDRLLCYSVFSVLIG